MLKTLGAGFLEEVYENALAYEVRPAGLQAVVVVSKPFDADTIANVQDFLAFLRGRCAIPVVSKGYRSTILLDWELTASCPLQIEEAFGDRLEVYHFKPTFDVWNEAPQGRPTILR